MFTSPSPLATPGRALQSPILSARRGAQHSARGRDSKIISVIFLWRSLCLRLKSIRTHLRHQTNWYGMTDPTLDLNNLHLPTRNRIWSEQVKILRILFFFKHRPQKLPPYHLISDIRQTDTGWSTQPSILPICIWQRGQELHHKCFLWIQVKFFEFSNFSKIDQKKDLHASSSWT